MTTFGLCLLGAYAFIGLPWLVLMAFTFFCCRVVHECLRSKYPPQQFVKDSAVESAILPTERLGGKSIWIGSEGFAVQDFAPHRFFLLFPGEVCSCPGSTVFRLCVLIFLRSKCCLHKRLVFFRWTFFHRIISRSFGFLSVCTGQVLVQLFLPMWDETLPDSDVFWMTLESRLPAAT